MGIRLADAAGGALFAIPDDDWNVIENRVESAIDLSAVAEEVTQYLPGFDALVVACRVWRDRTGPDIGAAARSLVDYCDQAIVRFGEVRAAVCGPLTPQVRQLVVDALGALERRTVPLNEEFHRLVAGIADFTDLNRAVDGEVDRYVNRLGRDWRSIIPQTDRLADVAGRVRGVWQAMGADLDALVSGRIDVTDPFIADLELGAALDGWADLRSEALSYLGERARPVPT